MTIRFENFGPLRVGLGPHRMLPTINLNDDAR
jgi:hypothetical protein